MTTVLCLMNFQMVFASEVNFSDSTTPLEKRTTYVSTTTVYIDGEALEVPVEIPLTQSYSSFSYGTTQTVPSSWVPVLTVGTDYNRGYHIPFLYYI